MDKLLEEFQHVQLWQSPDGRVRFQAVDEDSTTQLAMHDLYQEILILRAKLVLRDKLAKQGLITPVTPPRYDDVYFGGIKELFDEG
jgi:hypothetical protein